MDRWVKGKKLELQLILTKKLKPECNHKLAVDEVFID